MKFVSKKENIITKSNFSAEVLVNNLWICSLVSQVRVSTNGIHSILIPNGKTRAADVGISNVLPNRLRQRVVKYLYVL